MKLQKGKWYVCIRNWSNDGWTKFYDGMLVRCEKDDELTDCYDISHMFLEDDEPERYFRQVTEIEGNIASATEVNMKEFMEEMGTFSPYDTLEDIYRRGAKDMLRHIKSQMSIKG